MRAVLVHGFTQSPSAWDAVRGRLAEGAGPRLDVLAPAVPDDLDFVATADHLARAHGPGVFCGYSMGGRLCLRAALDSPHLVRGLVVVSGSPGIEDDDERAARARADDALAGDVARAGVEAFLRRWLAQPLFATLAGPADEAAQRAERTTVARLQHQLRVLGQGVQEPLWSRLPELDIPRLGCHRHRRQALRTHRRPHGSRDPQRGPPARRGRPCSSARGARRRRRRPPSDGDPSGGSRSTSLTGTLERRCQPTEIGHHPSDTHSAALGHERPVGHINLGSRGQAAGVGELVEGGGEVQSDGDADRGLHHGGDDGREAGDLGDLPRPPHHRRAAGP